MLGLVSVTHRKLSPEAILSVAADAGLEGIEWGSDIHVPPADLPHARRIGALTREAGLTVTSYGSYYRLGAGQDFAPYAKTACALGTSLVRIWAGTRGSAAVDTATRRAWATEARAVAAMAAAHGLTVAFEYHPGTLTDTVDSALDLLQEVDHPACRTYWQPDFQKPYNTLAAEPALLGPWLAALHVFHWDAAHNRLPLAAGADMWCDFLRNIPLRTELPCLLEFLPNDDPARLAGEAAALRHIVATVLHDDTTTS